MKKHFVFVCLAVLSIIYSVTAFSPVLAQQQGQTIAFEGYVESVAKNSLLVDGRILVVNEYSSISTNGANIYIGDFVMGFIYLNEDNKSYTIVSLAKIIEKSLGTPTPVPTATHTPIWAGLFTETPALESTIPSVTTTVDPQSVLWDVELFGTFTPTATILPTATQSNIAFEGIVDQISDTKISVNGISYAIDKSTGYGKVKPETGDYVQGRAAPYLDRTTIRFIEVIPEYDRPDAVEETLYGRFVSQDKEKIILEIHGDNTVPLYLYRESKMNKTYYTKGMILKAILINGFVRTVSDFSVPNVSQSVQAVSGIIDRPIEFDDEICIIADNIAYTADSETIFIPSKTELISGKPFIGLTLTGKLKAVFFSDNNRVKELNGTISVMDKSDPERIRFSVGGIEYLINNSSIVTSNSIRRNSNVKGYADSVNNILFLSVSTPWYADLMDWNWEIIGPCIILVLSIILFVLLHKSKAEGYLQEVRGNTIVLTDSRGENRKHYICNEEITKFVNSLVTMKVEVIIHRGKVVHIRYDF